MRSDIPKVLHDCNWKPMLVCVLESVCQLNPDKVIVVAGKHQSRIILTLENWLDCHKLVFIHQTVPMGTGHAVQCCVQEFSSEDTVLIVNGDMPFIGHHLLARMLDQSADIDGMVLTAVLTDPYGYGRILYQHGKFSGIVEEKDCSEEQKKIQEVNSGVYILKGYVLHDCLPKIQNNNKQQEYYLTDVIRHAPQYNIQTFKIQEEKHLIQIRGVNTPEELQELSELQNE